MTTLKINGIIINVGKDVVINVDGKATVDVNNEIIEITTEE
jgi:hypothetical protein